MTSITRRSSVPSRRTPHLQVGPHWQSTQVHLGFGQGVGMAGSSRLAQGIVRSTVNEAGAPVDGGGEPESPVARGQDDHGDVVAGAVAELAERLVRAAGVGAGQRRGDGVGVGAE